MLNDRQLNQLRYELRRKFMNSVDAALDNAIGQITCNGVNFGDAVAINLKLKVVVSKDLKDGVIQLEAISQ